MDDLELLKAEVARLKEDNRYINEVLNNMTRVLAPMVLEYRSKKKSVGSDVDIGGGMFQ